MFGLLVFLHVEYFLCLFHCFLLELLELLHLLRCLLLTESRLKLVLKLRLNNGRCRVTQGQRHHFVIGGGVYWFLSFSFVIMGRFLLEVLKRDRLGLRFDSDCLSKISLTVGVGSRNSFSAASNWRMDILFIEKEGHLSLGCHWLNDLSIHFLPASSHHYVTNRIELNMPIIVR